MDWLQKSSTGRALVSVFGRAKPTDNVKPGLTFRHVNDDKMEETAKVISVADDPFGIPHVRFHLSFRRPNRNFFDGGARMLALESFVDHYNEQVEPAAL